MGYRLTAVSHSSRHGGAGSLLDSRQPTLTEVPCSRSGSRHSRCQPRSFASGSATVSQPFVEAFRKGYASWGAEGQNIGIEYRFAEERRDRLTDLAADAPVL